MKEKKKSLILKVAQELFAKFGFFKTTVDEIAKAARMGKASLYHYFKGKEEIYKNVIEKESQILHEKIQEAISREDNPYKKLKAFVLTRMKCLNELSNIYNALKNNNLLKHYHFIEKIREKDFHREIETVKSILREGIQKNIFAIKDIELTSFAIVSAFKGLEYPWTVKIPSSDIEKNIDKLLEILFHGLLKK